MESGFDGRGLLKRALFFSLIIFTAYTVFAAVAPSPAFADGDEDKLEADAHTAGALILLQTEYGIEDVLRKDIIEDYEGKYRFDHTSPGGSGRIAPGMNAYTTVLVPPTGYRYKNALQKDIYSDIYKARRQALIGQFESVLGANASEGLINMNQNQVWINGARDASMSADGYRKILESATQESNLMNVEILQLRADTLRQTDIQLAAADVEMQDEADETAAFEQAVKTWTTVGTAANY